MFVAVSLDFRHFVGLVVVLICGCGFVCCRLVFWCACVLQVFGFWLFVICYLFGWCLTVGVCFVWI